MRPIEEIHAALQRIHAKACDHAAPAYMSVPANPERDADLIVSDAIAELAALRRTLGSARASIRLVLNRDKISEWTAGALREAETEIDAALRGKEGT